MSSTNINQLQILQQNLQNVLIQKQQFQSQILEIDSALKELKSTEKAYKIVGKIMLASNKEELVKDLNGKKEVIELRIKNFEQQEKKLQESIESVQKEVMKEMIKENNAGK